MIAPRFFRQALAFVIAVTAANGEAPMTAPAKAEQLLTLDNGTARIGIDRNKGGSITWLSFAASPDVPMVRNQRKRSCDFSQLLDLKMVGREGFEPS
ncbi:hypothetical protein ACFQY0_17630 [Haloferula chungangensis]|uniref:Uncharacterized protein n=1 Tax=Haloferula chungangensis TaxID=1048331 RepID=A0ABW2LE16_9BACT